MSKNGTVYLFERDFSPEQIEGLTKIISRLGAILGPEDAAALFDAAQITRIGKIDRDRNNLFVEAVVKIKL